MRFAFWKNPKLADETSSPPEKSAIEPRGNKSNDDRPASINNDALDIIAEGIFRSGWSQHDWFVLPEIEPEDWTEGSEIITGVAIRSQSGSIRSFPSGHPGFQRFEDAVAKMSVKVAIKMCSTAIESAIRRYM